MFLSLVSFISLFLQFNNSTPPAPTLEHTSFVEARFQHLSALLVICISEVLRYKECCDSSDPDKGHCLPSTQRPLGQSASLSPVKLTLCSSFGEVSVLGL